MRSPRSIRHPKAFLGIPYARAPVGELRFRPPEPLPHSSPARASARLGPPAPQRPALPPALRRLIRAASPLPSEDCLSLNVWTPEADASHRPVLVWIHGGGFTSGSGGWFVYDGEQLARDRNLVVVTLNYRLGALGALNTQALDSASDLAPNLGLRDQIAALEWVRDNIEAFGGDPENVTVAGQSAGAMSIGALLHAPDARGLFHKAILQSGAASNVLTREQAGAIAERFLTELGIEAGSGERVARALRSLPIREILRAQAAVSMGNRLPLGTMAWQPSYDGELLIERHPNDQPDQSSSGEPGWHGWHGEIPILIGTTRDEWKMFTAMDRKRRDLDDARLRHYLARSQFGAATLGPERAREAGTLYERCEETGERRRPGQLWVAFQTDRVFRQPAIALADARSRSRSPTYFYRFDWEPRVARERVGACHSLDVPFTFGTIRHPLLLPLLGWSGSARRLSRQIQAAWAAFAAGGDPSCSELPPWSAYEPEHRFTMLLGARPRCVESPGDEARRFWSRATRD